MSTRIRRIATLKPYSIKLRANEKLRRACTNIKVRAAEKGEAASDILTLSVSLWLSEREISDAQPEYVTAESDIFVGLAPDVVRALKNYSLGVNRRWKDLLISIIETSFSEGPALENVTPSVENRKVVNCLHCGYEWSPRRDTRPAKCANIACQRADWDRAPDLWACADCGKKGIPPETRWDFGSVRSDDGMFCFSCSQQHALTPDWVCDGCERGDVPKSDVNSNYCVNCQPELAGEELDEESAS